MKQIKDRIVMGIGHWSSLS